MSKRALILNGDSYHAAFEMFKRHGWEPTRNLGDADLVCFLGGTDVDPKVYGEERGPYTQSPDRARDEFEVLTYYSAAVALEVPCVGICRGGQLLNVLNGGKMIQHLGRCISGDVIMEKNIGVDGLVGMKVRVDHHQGMIKHYIDGDLLGFFRDDVVEQVSDYVIWYPETKSLCFQPHPEWGHKPTEDLFFQLIEEYIECVD